MFFLCFLFCKPRNPPNSASLIDSKRYILLLVLVKCSFLGVNSASSPLQVGMFNQFLARTVVQVDTTNSYGNPSASWNPLTYNLSYPSTFVQVTSAEFGLGLQQLKIYYAPDKSFHAYARISSLTSSSFQLNIYSSNTQYLSILKYVCIVIGNHYRTFMNFRFLMNEFSVNVSVNFNSGTPTYYRQVDPPLNSTTATVWHSFYGIDLIASS